MSNPNPMFLAKPFSLAHARSMFGGSSPKNLAMLVPLMVQDYDFQFDSFLDYLNTSRWTVPVTGGGGPTPFAITEARGGVIQGLTGAPQNGVVAIHSPRVHWDPADNPFMLIRWQANTVTSLQLEMGFSDAKSSEVLPGVTDIDTPAAGNGVSDMVCLHMDTGESLKTGALVGVGTSTGIAATTIYTDGGGGSTGWTPTAGKWIEVMIGVRPGLGYAAIWDAEGLVGNKIWAVNSGPDSGQMVRPYALFRTLTTQSRTIEIDGIGYGNEKNES